MLDLRPNCELCDCDLPPESLKARICSYECTYCADCVDGVMQNVCLTCGGGFAPRPVRPKGPLRAGKNLGLGAHPASQTRVHSPYSPEDIKAHIDSIKDTPPDKR